MHDQNEPAALDTSAKIPLFYLGGDPPSQPLARGLRARHPFHGLGIQASVVRQLKNPYSLRCIAELFATIICEKQPRGPYMLGGWCAHGVLALETAQILREQGQEVALLVLLETVNPEKLRRHPRLAQVMAKLGMKTNLPELEYKYLRSLPKEPAIEYVYGRIPPRFTGLRGRNSKEIQLTRSTPLEILYTAVGNYLPRPYDSPVLLIRSSRGAAGPSRDTHLGWGKTLGNELEICETEGNHFTMCAEPNVAGLVQKVSESLRLAEQRWRQQHHHTRQIA